MSISSRLIEPTHERRHTRSTSCDSFFAESPGSLSKKRRGRPPGPGKKSLKASRFVTPSPIVGWGQAEPNLLLQQREEERVQRRPT